MTDKVQKIREEVEKRYEYWKEKEFTSHSIESEIRMSECQHLLLMINSLQEEPVSEELEEAALLHLSKNYDTNVIWDEDEKCVVRDFKAGAKWQKAKDESTTEDLGEYVNELSKQFPEVSFAKLNRIAVRVAKWQKEQDQETIELAEDHAMLAGMEKAKEQMMTKSIEAVVSQVPCSNEIILYNPCSVDKYYLPQEMNKLGLNKGDKVKLVIIKED